ncbi:MAG: sigma-70 family RNA polymerase sigma factor [Planctomycetota bacterium]|nr:sigma-70 family RNA polymerase sigma factor [Planctomycetota bacterium]
MQAIDHALSGNLLSTPGAEERLRERIDGLADEVGAEEYSLMVGILEDRTRSTDSVRDALSTRLMERFRIDRSRACFGLLYELNSSHLLIQVGARLRRYNSHVDGLDVLQEIFFNVYRYPHRFDCTRDDAFRVWSAMIVRNTVLKQLRKGNKGGRREVPFEDLSDQPETRAKGPLGGAIEMESQAECTRVYVTYLQLYLSFYSMLSVREQRALHLVEIDGASYRDTASELGIKLENLKMVIFRARRKIHRAMRRVFDGLPPDCKPARDPIHKNTSGGRTSAPIDLPGTRPRSTPAPGVGPSSRSKGGGA